MAVVSSRFIFASSVVSAKRQVVSDFLSPHLHPLCPSHTDSDTHLLAHSVSYADAHTHTGALMSLSVERRTRSAE